MAYIAIFIVKLISIAGIGSLITGFFVKTRTNASIAGLVFGALDTAILSMISSNQNIANSLLFACLAGILAAHVSFTLRAAYRKSRPKA